MSKSHNVANLVVIALGTFVTFYSYYSLKLGILISPDAGFMPFLCGTALILLGIVWRIQTLISKSPRQAKHAAEPSETACEVKAAPLRASRIKLCLAFVATVIYASLFERIGFFLSTLLFMLGWQMAVERQRWLKAIIITILCAAAMYTLFKILLRVELPPNPLLS
jgi:putative tricarboxylic transport membrane protein